MKSDSDDNTIGMTGYTDNQIREIEAELNNKMNSIYIQDLELELSSDEESYQTNKADLSAGSCLFDQMVSGLKEYSIQSSLPDLQFDETQLHLDVPDNTPPESSYQRSPPIEPNISLDSTLDFLEAEARISIQEADSECKDRRDRAVRTIQRFWRGHRCRKSAMGKNVKAHQDSRSHRNFVARAEKIEFEERLRLQKECDIKQREKEEKLKKDQDEKERMLAIKEAEVKAQIETNKRRKKLENFKCKMIRITRERAASKIQHFWLKWNKIRKFREHRSARIIQNNWRLFYAYYTHGAAMVIQKNWRMCSQRRKYIQKRQAIVIIQRNYRKYAFQKSEKIKINKKKIEDIKEGEDKKRKQNFIENRAARTLQRYWKLFVERENKVSKILAETPRFIEPRHEDTIELKSPLSKQSIKCDHPEKSRKTPPAYNKQNVEMTKTIETGRTFISGQFDLVLLKTQLLNLSNNYYATKITSRLDILSIGSEFRTKLDNSECLKTFTKVKAPTSTLFAASNTLRFVDLTGISLTKFAADLPNCLVLKLNKNKIRDFKGRLPRLLYLDISENRLSRWSLPPLPHCHAVIASGNQLIDLSGIEKTSPRLFWLEANENFLIDSPSELKFLSKLSLSNNSITRFRSDSPFLTQVDLSFNNLEADSEFGMFPILDDSGMLWNDHISQSNTSIDSPVRFYSVTDLARFIKLNQFSQNVLSKIDMLKSLRIILESTSCLDTEFPTHLRRFYAQILRIKSDLRSLVNMNQLSISTTNSASKIQKWWRQLARQKLENENRKRAVAIIEAWWIGTTTRLKIDIAVKSATAFGNEDFEVDDFDFSNLENQLAEIESTLHFETEQTEKHKIDVRHRPRSRTAADLPPPIPIPAARSKPDGIYYESVGGQMQRIPTLAERYVESKPNRFEQEKTVLLTHRSHKSHNSKSSKKISKIDKFKNSWGVSDETAKLMARRERMMKGSQRSTPVKKRYSKSQIDPSSPRKEKNNVPMSDVGAGTRGRIQNWVNAVDPDRTPTPNNPNSPNSRLNIIGNTTLLGSIPSVLEQKMTKPPLPPIKKSKAWV